MMQRKFKTDFDNFDKNFRRMQIFVKIWFAFIAILMITMVSVAGWAIYEVSNDPAMIGRTVGEVVKGYEETVQ